LLAGAVALVAVGCAETPPAGGARAPGNAGDEHELPIPADLAPAIQQSIDVGRALYLHDKASAIGTDVVKAMVPDLKARGIGGWLTMRTADAEGKPTDTFGVRFVSKAEPHRTLFTVDVPLKGPSIFKEVSPPAPLDTLGERVFRARQTAIAAVPHGPRPWNPVILPGSLVGRGDAICVYLLAAELVPGEMVFGLHYRVIVSEDGSKAEEVVPLSRSALVMNPNRPDPAIPKGATPVARIVSQIVTDWPSETHVFVSLLHHRAPIYVVTKRGVWRVVGDEIALVDDKVPVAPK
jgi:hypothetical protein